MRKYWRRSRKFKIGGISPTLAWWRKSAVKRKCLQKGIASDLFEQVWEEEVSENLNSEVEKLADLKAKVMRKYKIDAWGKVDPKTKGKVLNYLQYRGFNAFEIWQQWQTEEEEE
jgi:regulatory protein